MGLRPQLPLIAGALLVAASCGISPGDDLTGADLSGRSLERADLRGCVLDGASLEGADLSNAHLDDASMKGANLRGANLNGAWLNNASLEMAILEEADLTSATLNRASLVGANLERASMNGARLQFTNLEDANLRDAVLQESEWVTEGGRTRKTPANLDHAILKGASLIGADLANASLRSAVLDGADLRGANLSGTQLGGASLVRANLEDARLTDVSFHRRSSSTPETSFLGATVTGAMFDGLSLVETTGMTEAMLASTASSAGARLHSRDEILAALGEVSDGHGIPSCMPYEGQLSPPMVFVGEYRWMRGEHNINKTANFPRSIQATQLVARLMVGQEVVESGRFRSYLGGASIDRVRWYVDLKLIEAQTGALLASTRLVGSMPRAFKAEERLALDEKWIEGSSVRREHIVSWFERQCNESRAETVGSDR